MKIIFTLLFLTGCAQTGLVPQMSDSELQQMTASTDKSENGRQRCKMLKGQISTTAKVLRNKLQCQKYEY